MLTKCADVPDQMVLDGIKALREPDRSRSGGYRWVMSWDLLPWLRTQLETEVPPNLYYAKMRKLIKRGTVKGCWCGCRGDYWLPYDPDDS